MRQAALIKSTAMILVISAIFFTVHYFDDQVVTSSGVNMAPTNGMRSSAVLPAADLSAVKPEGMNHEKLASDRQNPLAGLRLAAVFRNVSNSKLSCAIIEKDSDNMRICVGALLRPGLVLVEVNSDHVLLQHHGENYRLGISSAVVHDDSIVAFKQEYDGEQDFMQPPDTGVRRVSKPSEIDRVSRSTYSENESEQDSSVTEQHPDSLSVFGSGPTLQGLVSSFVTGAPVKSSGTETSGRQREDGNHGLPTFMSVANSDAYVPAFMQGGGLEVSGAQVPDYMN